MRPKTRVTPTKPAKERSAAPTESRGLTNLIANADGTFKCKDTQPCVLQKDRPPGKGKGKDKVKEKDKGKKKVKKLTPPDHKTM